MIIGTRNNAELAAAVILRAAELLKEKSARQNRSLAVVSVSCFTLICLFTMLGNLSVNQGISPPAQASIVELMGGAVAGGYVLVGVITFALGVAVTLVCLRAKERKKQDRR